MGKLVTLRCRDCGKEYVVDDMKPLNELIHDGEVDEGHRWLWGWENGAEDETLNLCHRTEDDNLEPDYVEDDGRFI